MLDSSDLIHKADELKQQAVHEPDARIQARLIRMAESYIHLAQSQAWSREHPASVAALGEIFVKRE